MKKYLLKTCLIVSAIGISSYTNGQIINLQKVGSYTTGLFDQGATEISTFDPATDNLFSVNASTGGVDVINLSDVTAPVLSFSIDLSPYGAAANSITSRNGVIAVAVEDSVKQNNGKVVFFDALGNYINQVTVGALPDMLIFTPNGKKLLVANEGEPSDDYLVDPQGTISIIDLLDGIPFIDDADVTTIDFTSFDLTTFVDGTRVFGPGAAASTDFEPEYITVSKNSKFAYVTLQENNAIAIINLVTNTVSISGLGFKNHNLVGNELDASDKNGAVVDIKNWPVFGMYQPDAIEAVNIGGINYLVMANEGDARDYDGFAEVSRINGLLLDSIAFPDSLDFKNDNNLGRLNVTTTMGDTDGDGDYDELYSFGARSFTIRTTAGALVYDSGSLLETITNSLYPANFNCSSTSNTKKGRSDDKGPEPEGLTTATIGDSVYLFLGLERISGVMVFNITNPASPYFVQFANDRDFGVTPAAGVGGDQGPEGLLYISSKNSPNGRNLLVVSNEISGSIAIYQTDNTCGIGKVLICYEGTTYCVKTTTAATLLALGGVYGDCGDGRYASDEIALEDINQSMLVYPNPASDIVHIDLSEINGNNAVLSIVDITGAITYSNVLDVNQINSGVVTINTAKFQAGIYFVNCTTELGVISSKLIID